jgi:integrase/recombinase XerC
MTPLARFARYLSSELSRSLHTADAYLRDAEKLLALAQGRDLATLTTQDIRGFVRQLASQGLSARSIARHLSAWRSWYHLLIRDAGFSHNPCVYVRPPKTQKKLPTTLSPDITQHFLESVPETTPLAARDKAIFELAYSSGLRVSELATLCLSDLNLAEGTLTVRGKGDKTRVVPFGQPCQHAINAWLILRVQLAQPDTYTVFVTKQGKKMTTRAIELRFKQWGIKVGITTPLYPHLMRHSCASHLLQSSQDLRAVQEMLGHASIQTTQVYTHLDYQHLAKIYDQAHPRAKQKP